MKEKETEDNEREREKKKKKKTGNESLQYNSNRIEQNIKPYETSENMKTKVQKQTLHGEHK